MTSTDLPLASAAPAPGFRITPRIAAALIAMPALLYMLVVYALPLLMLFGASFQDADGLSVRGYRKILSDPYYLSVIWNSVQLGLITTAISLLVGYPAAWGLARLRGGLQVFGFALIFLPLTVSVIVKTFGLSIVMRRDGFINWFLMNTGITDAPIRLVFTEFSLYLGMVNVFIPYMILSLYSVFRMIDDRLFDAASSLGASPMYRLTHVLIPLSMPGIISGVSLVFSLSVAAYVTPSLLIGDSFMTMSAVMAKSFLNVRDFQLGSSMGVLLLMIAARVVVAASVASRKVNRSSK